MSFLHNNHLRTCLNLSVLFLIVFPALWNVHYVYSDDICGLNLQQIYSILKE